MDSISKREIQSSNSLGELRVSDLVVSDLLQVRAIAKGSFSAVWSEADFGYFLAHGCGKCIGIFKEEELYCYALSLLTQGDLDVISLATHESRRRQGYAQLILQEIERTPGVRRIYLEVEETNIGAIQLYEKAGFKRYGIRKKYYQGLRDAVLMQKCLAS